MIGFYKNIFRWKWAFLFLLLVSGMSIKSQSYVNESVLKTGTWFKMGVTEEGFYKISYYDLLGLGLDPDSIHPKKISIFGNVAGMLPESNSELNPDDLNEIDIIVQSENDNSFDEGDYILFYGQSPVKWKYDSHQLYHHYTNYYSDTTYYFLRIDGQEDGARIIPQGQSQEPAQKSITSFKDYCCHEIDMNNKYRQGRRWYGETVSGATNTEKRFSFNFKNALDTLAYAYFNLVGASSTEKFYAKIKINEKIYFDNILVNKVGEHVFGLELIKSTYFEMKDDDVDIDIGIMANNLSSLIGVDYIELNVWRKLRYENEDLRFGIVTEQFDSESNRVIIENTNQNNILFNITNPLHPTVQDADNVNGFINFLMIPNGFKSFILTEESNYRNVLSIKRIDNQNLHSISTAEMLIITPSVFMDQAEELKQIHEENDALNSVVVDIDKIYNEFSTGALDVSGIRNFIRMVYNRDHSLKYVLLFGRGTSDYKNVMGLGNNFIPPYEAIETYNEINSYVTDDYYALMDSNEGFKCKGIVDLGIGRIPVTTVEEAENAISKIRSYISKKIDKYGDWRNKILFVADDNVVEYAKNCDYFEKIVNTNCNDVNVDKIYEDSYVRVSTSIGYEYPEAIVDLSDKIEEGCLIISYIGHGGVKGLTDEGLLREKHILAFENIDNLEFIHAGTCEFSKFDDPTYLSAGEKLFLNPNGGAIGMFTTTRPTMIGNNFTVGKNMYLSVFEDGNIKDMTFGDLVKGTKARIDNNQPKPGFLCYVLFGDPALRLVYPQKDIIISEINGVSIDSIEGKIEIGALADVRVKGDIVNENGKTDTSFNGYLYPKMFDNKSNYHTLGNTGSNNYDFKLYKDIVYQGKVSINNGCFDFSFKIPMSVNYQENLARLTCYAVDTVNFIDATGSYNNIKITGVDSNVIIDNQGPAIQMVWNSFEDKFTNDNTSGVLEIDFFDPQGIMHYGNAIGRDIILTHNILDEYTTEIVNNLFEPATDDFTKGKIRINYDKLKNGEHHFTVKAWDTHGNSSEKSLSFLVDSSDTPVLMNVVNKPNPFTGETAFCFNYKKDNVSFDLLIDIYDVTGRKVNALVYKGLNSSITSIKWNGCDSSGFQLKSGVYLYRFYIKDNENEEFVTTQRMVVIR